MEYRLRGKSYAIANSSDTLLSKIAISMQRGMADPEDDARVAYAIATACPSIPPDVASYSKDGFKLTLDSLEIAAFMLTLNILILERSKVQSSGDKAAIARKIKELKKGLTDLDKGLSPEQVKLILKQISVEQVGDEEATTATAELVEEDEAWEAPDTPLTPEQEMKARKLLGLSN